MLAGWRRRRRGECVECGTVLDVHAVPECHGRSGTASVGLRNLPVLACPTASHPKRFVDPDFGATLIDQLFWHSSVPVSRTGFGGKQSCHQCGAHLDGPTLSYLEVTGEITVADCSPIAMRVSAAGATCMACGHPQIYASDEVSNDISDALIKAFEMISLRP